MFSLFTLALEQHIRFANSICFGLNFLSKQMDGNLLSPASCQCQQAFLCDSEHTTGSTGSVYKDAVFDTNENPGPSHPEAGNIKKSRAFTGPPVIPAEL